MITRSEQAEKGKLHRLTIAEIRRREPVDLHKIVLEYEATTGPILKGSNIRLTAYQAIESQRALRAQEGWHYLDRLDALADFMHRLGAKFVDEE